MLPASIATKAVFGLGASGGVTAFAGFIATETGASSIAPWFTAGGTGVMATALAYIAKMFADGRLVSRPVHDQMISEAASRAESQKRESILSDLTRDAHEREDRLWNMLPRQERR